MMSCWPTMDVSFWMSRSFIKGIFGSVILYVLRGGTLEWKYIFLRVHLGYG